jgi:hypothetical protein
LNGSENWRLALQDLSRSHGLTMDDTDTRTIGYRMKPWTADEERKILLLRDTGKTPREISLLLGRSQAAIEARFRKVRLEQSRSTS